MFLIEDFEWRFHKFTTRSRDKTEKGKLLQRSPDFDLLKKQFDKFPDSHDKLYQPHTGNTKPPVGKISMGALGVLLDTLQGGIKAAIDEEKAEYDYD